MTMAAAIGSRTAEVRSPAGRIARVEIIGDLGEAEAVWRTLEGGEQFSTPYQRFDFLAAWQRHVGEREQASPFIVVASDAERRPLLLLPLTLRRDHGVRTASFMGGKHTTFNMALWDRDFAGHATAADLDALLAGLRARGAADALSLTRQPQRWRDLVNPFTALSHQPSINGCPVMTIAPGAAPAELISNSFRRRLKSKERKLQALPGYRYLIASDEAEIGRLLDWFFRVKPLRMAEHKLPNVFADAGVEDFIRDISRATSPDGKRVVDVHALACDEEVIALFAGVADGHRFSMMFNTYTLSEHSRFSPGLILLRNIVDHYAGRGFRALDLGIGTDEYKRLFCKLDEPIFDSFVALSGRGRVAATAMSVVARGKHLVKQNQRLLDLAQKLRHRFG
ncbi:MAG: GNAT family N-acetyltransferase [Bradyrhizobium sp.]|uniref:GNAT family N-acetyltransferase n=1 Tax=Bradyrhizobium sp. TaxID=376 RepID=UPI001DFF828F|nr:GNAT family N-acetyltransferase [Bradyrhizobium sp.]MBV9565734.1 GNAT family N-acetyltransferase [Bradyrhizobium sp.]